MTKFVIGLLAAGLWIVVVISMMMVRRSSPGHPFSSIRRYRKGTRALASSAEAAGDDYEPSLFGGGPWPMETPLDLHNAERAEPPAKPRPAPPPVAPDAAPRATQARETQRQEEDTEVIQTRRRRKHREPQYVPTLGDRLLAEAEAQAAAEQPAEPVDLWEPAEAAAPSPAPGPAAAGQSPAGGRDISEWGPSRRGLFRRRKTEDDLLSPAFARQTEEPKLVVKLGKPQDEEPSAEAPAAPAAPRSGARRPRPRRIDITDEAVRAAAEPRIIPVTFADEAEEEEPEPAPVWVQRVVPMPEQAVVHVPELPQEAQEADAEEEEGLLAHALLRATETPLEGTPPPRPAEPAAAPPPGSMPVPLPFIRGIGRTRTRVAAQAGPPPAVVHIQTIHLDEEGEPVVVTEEEAAETAAREAALPEVTRSEPIVELDLPTLDTPAMQALESVEPERASAAPAPAEPWEPELPADAPWFHEEPAAAPRAEAAEEAPDAFWDDPSHDEGPSHDEDEIVILSAAPEATEAPEATGAPASPPEPQPGAADVEPRRIPRPAAIEARPGRRPDGPAAEGDRLRARRLGGPRGAGEPEASGVSLTTGRAVRPKVTVNLTEEDIEDSDELYEVEALLDAITRDPKKKRRGPFRSSQPAPAPVPMSSHVIRRERPAGEAEARPAAASSSAPPPAAPTPTAPTPVALPLSKGEVPTPPIRRPAPPGSRAEHRTESRPRPEVRQAPPEPRPARPEPRPQAPAERRPATASPVERPRPWGERTAARAPMAPAPGTNGAHKPEPRREPPARPAEPKAPARRRASRGPVTLILVDDEGRPQSD